MKLNRLRITIEPLLDSVSELRVEALVDGVAHTVSMRFRYDHFNSQFETLMEDAMKEIKRLVKEKGQ